MTMRALIAGLVFSVVLCAMNSYLTLSFGVIEEGPTIAALFFFAVFFLSKTKITTTEMVIVATMGSAGGSFGFISNFYAAKAMTGTPYSVTDMALFGIVSSLVGLVMAVPLRQMLILRDNLPWPGSKAVEAVIRALVEHGDRRQPRILLGVFLVGLAYVVLNNDGGFGVVPAATVIPGLAGVGGAIAWSPFAIGGSYLMGMRTCVGFLVGASALMIIAGLNPELPGVAEGSPHRWYWPGLGFLTASGMTVMVINWRTLTSAIASLVRPSKADDPDPAMNSRTLAAFATFAFGATVVVLGWRFAIPILMTVVLILVAGLIQNIIATRAAAQAAFNPARVMGILLQGVTSALPGGKSVDINLTGAGFVAGSGGQASLLTGDMVYGAAFRVPTRWQFWTQTLTVVPCAIVSAYAFEMINADKPLVLDGPGHPAPVAKMWAESARVFENGIGALSNDKLIWLGIGAAIGVVYALLEHIPAIRKYLPDAIGIGLGLVLSPANGLSFFLGGFLLWIVLGRWLKWSDTTLTTIAVGSIVAEGIGGVAQTGLFNAFAARLPGG
ncbi:MAG: OPT/YSL family transporter [Deltaproteobacteria bacterium]|nr:OPT/YSL family transporter [Deltaproteobacteria bacterium]